MSLLPLAFASGLGAAIAQIGFMAVFLVLAVLFSSLKVLREYERAVVFRLGRFTGVRGPGLVILIPGLERMVRVDTRIITLDIPPQDVITKDNVSIQINAVVYFRVMAPDRAIIEIENFLYATSQLAQTTLRSIAGQAELDELLSDRDTINDKLQGLLDEATDAWGIKVSQVELKHIDLPTSMQRAMARQAEAERERRAKVIAADGELQASVKLTEAAHKMAEEPISVQLRFLQTLTEVAAEKNSTLVLPIPIELLRAFESFSKSVEPALSPAAPARVPTAPPAVDSDTVG
jgi:regulator of protease activity HflC (stomatin/prohibitin superfamily)